MNYIVDRVEGGHAVCEAEDRSMVDIPLSELPIGIKEGDRINLCDGKYSLLLPEDDRKKRIRGLMNDLWTK